MILYCKLPLIQTDIIIPIFETNFSIVFYFNENKVAEALINPFGDDVDDFTIDEYIKRNLQVRYSVMNILWEIFDIFSPELN